MSKNRLIKAPILIPILDRLGEPKSTKNGPKREPKTRANISQRRTRVRPLSALGPDPQRPPWAAPIFAPNRFPKPKTKWKKQKKTNRQKVKSRKTRNGPIGKPSLSRSVSPGQLKTYSCQVGFHWLACNSIN